MNFFSRGTGAPPKTMSTEDVRRLLKVTSEHTRGTRDAMIFELALVTALREHELAALNVGDILTREGRVRRSFPLHTYKRARGTVAAQQEAFLSGPLRTRLERYLKWKAARQHDMGAQAPLFISNQNRRISTRQLRYAFTRWQERAGIERHYTFHSMRHTALTRLYRCTRDLRLVQRVARHKDVSSTCIYAGASDEDVFRGIDEVERFEEFSPGYSAPRRPEPARRPREWQAPVIPLTARGRG